MIALLGTAGLTATDAAAVDGNEVTLNALFVQESADGSSGGTNKFTIHYEKTKKKQFRVAFSEDEVSGTGDQWRSAGWNAAAVATILTGAPLSGAEVTFDVNGRIDGPSAGALMTIGLLSLIRGDTIKKDITMTGTINPDGTVGPVGGIPYKVDGVVEAKKDRMLIPLGQHNSADDTGELVDVVRLGRSEGIEVREVGDIYEAYKAFTGKTLPRPKRADVELTGDTYDAIAAKVKSLQADFDASATEFLALDPAIQSEFADLAIDADASAARAQDLSDNGLQAGAYNAALLAAAQANAAVGTGRLCRCTSPRAWRRSSTRSGRAPRSRARSRPSSTPSGT
ncbi:MAG TPA: S16 family serine protease [Acidimicrobiia bacterium]|nr:S16 family serine protease [Acidimicrobiia bacterium]